MDYEKKYKEALGWMQSLYKGLHGTTKEDAEHYFPELKESEDERVKKAITRILYENYTDAAVIEGVEIAKIVAWLEKQGEQKPADSYCKENCKGYQETGKCFADSECKAKKDAEQKPAWSDDDEKMMQCIHKYVKASASNFDYDNIQIWFRNLKKRVQPQQKQEWSEEDEKIRKELIDRFKSLKPYFSWYEVPIDSILAWLEKQGSAHFAWSEEDKKHLERAIYMMEQLNMTKSWDDVYNWLKSLKPQPHWKPSIEQLNALKQCIYGYYSEEMDKKLESLYNDLKKL